MLVLKMLIWLNKINLSEQFEPKTKFAFANKQDLVCKVKGQQTMATNQWPIFVKLEYTQDHLFTLSVATFVPQSQS